MSILYKNCKINLSNDEVSISPKLTFYVGDYNLDVYFTIIEEETNLLEKYEDKIIDMNIMKLDGTFKEIKNLQITKDNRVKFTFTKELSEELNNVGEYKIVFRISSFVDENYSIFTLPEVSFFVNRNSFFINQNEDATKLITNDGNIFITNDGKDFIVANNYNGSYFNSNYTGEQIDGAISDIINDFANKANLIHTHKTSDIINFPTKLSQFINDLNISGTQTSSASALITNFGAVDNNSVTYDSTTNKYIGVDCSQAILDAISSGYTKIEFPANGNFIVNSSISISKKVLIEGNGANIYVNPISGQDRNIFYFKSGSDFSTIRGLNFKSTKAYTVNLNTNVTAKSSNCCAIAINNGAKNVIVSDCNVKGFKYIVGCSNCSNVIIDNCSGEDNYFSVYTGYNAYNTTISRCDFSEQLETDIYGHVLYLGGGSYGVNVLNCNFKALGDNSSNIIKCGADQTEYCQDVIVENTIMKCRSKASFLYCHAHANVIYKNCIMEFSGSDSSSYARLLQFNNYSNMKFKGCNFILDSIQKYTQTDNSITDSTLIFEDCDFSYKNTINTYLTFDFTAGAKIFELINCNIDYTECTRAINMLRPALYSLFMKGCRIKLPKSSTLGYTSAGSVSFTQTQSPKLFLVDTIIEMPSGNATAFFGYVKGNTSAKVNVVNTTLLNGSNGSSYMLASSEYTTTANINAISW